MKRFLALVLSICICFTFFACNKSKGEETESDSKAPKTTVAFEKPKDYSTVLLITINPQFRLYLDADGNVLAVEAVNKDAEGIVDKLDFKDKDYKTVVENIVSESQKDGFVKDDVTVNIGIIESKQKVEKKTEMIGALKTAVNDTAKELDINITVDVKDESEPESTEAETTTATTTTPTTTKHTHKFSAATCTAPKKCSCGVTSGSALGHNYVNGVCSRCNAKDPNPHYTPAAQKGGVWISKHESGSELYMITVSVSKKTLDVGSGRLLESLPADVQESCKNDCEEYNGKQYYLGKGSGADIGVAESDNTLTLTDGGGRKLVLTRTAENTFKCTSVTDGFFGIPGIYSGLVFTYAAG